MVKSYDILTKIVYTLRIFNIQTDWILQHLHSWGICPLNLHIHSLSKFTKKLWIIDSILAIWNLCAQWSWPAHLGSDKRQLNNWLDGFAKLHSFKFKGDKVLFSGKMLESKNYLDSVAAGELTPQLTLNQFINPDDDWDNFEKFEIFYKVTS